MPLKTEPPTIQAVLERITHELTDFISNEMERRVIEALRPGGKVTGPSRPAHKSDRRHRESPTVEKKSVRERSETPASAAPTAAVEAARRTIRTPPKEPRALDMSCRVEGCSNRSRGPRLGFICDLHRAQLTTEQQLRAREAYKARARPSPPVSSGATGTASASANAGLSPSIVASAAPAAEPAEPVGSGAAAAGADYVLTIDRARLVASKKLGPTVELRFTVAQGPQLGRVARGRFPLAGRGLAVLIEAALGEPVDLSDAEALVRLVGRSVVADVVSAGNPDGSLAIVRNIRPASSIRAEHPR